MKKLLIFILLLSSLGMVSCGENNLELINSTYGNVEATELTHDSLEDKLADEESDGDDFILYVYTEGCTTCVNFETNILNKFITDTCADIYKINYTEIDYLIKTATKYQTNPRLIIFEDGKVKTQVTVKQNEDVFKNKTSFEKYLNKYVKISSLKEVNYIQLLSLLNDDSPKIIYYKWSACGDCSYLENHYLETFLKQNCIENFYAFDVKDYRQYKNSEDLFEKAIYYTFLATAKYEINDNKGVVPTFIYLENKEVKDYAIYFNDELVFDGEKVTVTKTAYGETDAKICKTYEDYDDYQEKTESYHTNKFKEFINKTGLVK